MSLRTLVELAVLALAGYAVGCLPVGWLLVRRERGIDLRRTGSGGTGAIDVLRSAGLRTALLAVVLEVVKGALVGTGARLWHDSPEFALAAIAGCVLGDAFPIGFRRGGRGLVPLLSGLFVAVPGAGTVIALVAAPTALLTGMRGRGYEAVVAVAVPVGLLVATRDLLSLLPAAVIVATLVARQRLRAVQTRPGLAGRAAALDLLRRNGPLVVDQPRVEPPEPRGPA